MTATERYRGPLWLGIAGAVAVLLASAFPLAFVERAGPGVIRAYSGAGLGGLWVVGAIAAALAIVFLAVERGRTEADWAAGITLGAGVILVAVAVLWALSVDTTYLPELTTDRRIEHHRWVVVGLSPVPAIASAWLARRLGVW